MVKMFFDFNCEPFWLTPLSRLAGMAQMLCN